MADSQQQFRSGQTRGQAKAKTDQVLDSARETAHSAGEKISGATQSAQQTAHENKDNASGFLSQTGEQVKNMAQGAVDSVKSTLGVGNNSNNPSNSPCNNTGSNPNCNN